MEDDVDPEIAKTVQKLFFIVEKKLLIFILGKGKYNSDLKTVKVFKSSMCEILLHLWRNVLTLGGNLERVDYTRDGYIPFTLSGWKNNIDNISPVSSQDIVYTDEKGTNICP